ncbi:MAG TPA: hypothetical protein VFE17_07555 [Candidatus Baltobacteraceae bacterium]|nr:hypothetical protein [Candidatus Baltobacteraceae bacterium]
MALLEFRNAEYRLHEQTIVARTNIMLAEHTALAHACQDARAAATVGMMAAGIVRPTSGNVFVAAFDPRIQPVQVKRIVGYVPHEALAPDFDSFTRYVEYRAALWALPRAETVVRARALLDRLDGVHEAFAYPLVGALLSQPALLVLDRPGAVYAAQILSIAADCAVFSTHESERDAQRFADALAVYR